MESEERRVESNHSESPTKSIYIVGFVLSLILTIVAYLLVQRHISTHHQAISHFSLILMIAILALIQLLVQLVFFLHLDTESKPRLNLTVLLFAATVVVTIVFGSLWIMDNLNYHGPSQKQVNEYLKSQGDL